MTAFDSIRIYDLETSGLDYDYDQVLEAAMISMDKDFNIVAGSEQVIPVCPRIDVPPHPEACLTHQLSLADLREKGFSEYDFSTKFLEQVSQPKTFIGGYNNLSFDDEVMRRTLFRTMRDPYGHEWRDGNSRFDVLNIVRTLYAWDPDTLNWPKNEEGGVCLKLSSMTKANNLTHDNAHNALSDVIATAELLQLIKNLGTPWLDKCLELTNKRAVERILAKRTPVFHVSPFYTRDRCYSSLILPVIKDLQSDNKVLCVDLTEDPTELLKMSAEEIRYYRFTPRNELQENPPSAPVTSISINKQPSVAEMADINPSLHARMGVDMNLCLERAKMIAADRGFASRLQQAFKLDLPPPKDTFGTIYSGGFFSRSDTFLREKVHLLDHNLQPSISSAKAGDVLRGSQDPRLEELAIRMQGINFPHALTNPADHERFLKYLERRLGGEDQMGLSVNGAREAIDLCGLNRILTAEDEAVLDDLREHLDWMEKQAGLMRTLLLEMGTNHESGLLSRPAADQEQSKSTPEKEPENSVAPSQGRRRAVLPFPTSLRRTRPEQAPANTEKAPQEEGTPCPF